MAGREKNCRWYFADQPNGMESGPNNPMEQSFKKNIYASLIRESIQNSLDAVLNPSEPVRMKFSFMGMRGADYPMFFELQEHIKGCLDYYNTNPNAKENYIPMLELFNCDSYSEQINYIRVSDYNTTGMAYNEGTDSPFYAFVRSEGVSAKGNNKAAGGSYGFGKAAYFLMSPISTIIVSTCTEKYDKYFEGISSLCTHTFRGTKKVAVGFYDDSNGKPISNEEDIPAKFRRSEPGTDINILGFDRSDKNAAIEEMAKSVLRNFWMAIMNERLIVEIDDIIIIDKDNLQDMMERYFEELDDTSRKSGYDNPRPYFDAVRNVNTSPKYLKFQGNLPLLGDVQFYVMKQKGAPDKIAYMRALEMLVYSKRNKTNYGMYGVFYCGSDEGNEILRHLENSAHDEWKPANWLVNNKPFGTGRIALQEIDNFITECLSQVFSLKEKKAIDIKGLEEFLYIPTAYEEDEELESESYIGKETGKLKDDGSSVTTDIADEDDNPTISERPIPPSTGHVMVNKTTSASNTTGGRLRSGHGDVKRKKKSPGIQKPGNASESRTEDESGERGLFASSISIPYRTFSQFEGDGMYHYVVLHSEEEIENVRLHFFTVGEDNETEELQIADSNIGNVSGNIIRDVHLNEGRLRIRVRFTDNMKHAIKLSAEELYEL